MAYETSKEIRQIRLIEKYSTLLKDHQLTYSLLPAKNMAQYYWGGNVKSTICMLRHIGDLPKDRQEVISRRYKGLIKKIRHMRNGIKKKGDWWKEDVILGVFAETIYNDNTFFVDVYQPQTEEMMAMVPAMQALAKIENRTLDDLKAFGRLFIKIENNKTVWLDLIFMAVQLRLNYELRLFIAANEPSKYFQHQTFQFEDWMIDMVREGIDDEEWEEESSEPTESQPHDHEKRDIFLEDSQPEKENKYEDVTSQVTEISQTPIAEDNSQEESVRVVFDRQYNIPVLPKCQSEVRYLGYVQSSGNTFRNFYPIAEFYNDSLIPIDSEQLKQAYPQWGAFNLKYQRTHMQREGALCVIDFDHTEIRDNPGPNGHVRTDFSKCIDFDTVYFDKRFHSAAEVGIHWVVYPKDAEAINFDKTFSVKMTNTGEDVLGMHADGEMVLVKVGDYYLGPVKLRENVRKQLYVDFSGIAVNSVVPGFLSQESALRAFNFYMGDTERGNPFVNLMCAETAKMKPVLVDMLDDVALLRRVTENAKPVDGHFDEKLIRRLDTDHPAINEARMLRLERAIRQSDQKRENRQVIADLLYRMLVDNREAFYEELVECVAQDELLAQAFADKALVLEKIRQKEQDLRKHIYEVEESLAVKNADNAKQDERAAKLREEVRSLLNERGELIQTNQLLNEKGPILRQLQRIDITLREHKEENEKLEVLHAELMKKLNEAHAKAESFGDDILPGKLSQAVSVWNEREEEARIDKIAQAVAKLDYQAPHGKELVDQLVEAIQVERRYDYNEVVNLYISIVQNFLTVFSGEPGSGKTSICHILAHTLGLDSFDKRLGNALTERISANRFVMVPVEYGWNTKRDFIGYWNPLTHRFESPDPKRWLLFKRLDREARSEVGSRYPAMMLLDEANLSPMEYYWSDWMRLCDNFHESTTVTLWDKAPTMVPQTLRFVATINNDSTTEPLSPRLIDRAMVISLPEDRETMVGGKLCESYPQPVPWHVLQETFGARDLKKNKTLVTEVLSGMEELGKKAGIRLSPRSRSQMMNYISAAMDTFNPNGKKAVWEDAVDFALLQKFLPHINGTGDGFAIHLNDMLEFCQAHCMNRTATRIEQIIENGREAMDCYRFF